MLQFMYVDISSRKATFRLRKNLDSSQKKKKSNRQLLRLFSSRTDPKMASPITRILFIGLSHALGYIYAFPHMI